MQHLYDVQSSAIINTTATNISAANTSSAELCFIATDDLKLSNELQNALEAESVGQTSTSKTSKEFEFGTLQELFNFYSKPVLQSTKKST
jgi:hypothetical protein